MATPSPEAGWPTYPGLTAQEMLILQALLELQEAAESALARRSGVSEAHVTAALDRLVRLGYAQQSDEAEGLYRPIARSPW